MIFVGEKRDGEVMKRELVFSCVDDCVYFAFCFFLFI